MENDDLFDILEDTEAPKSEVVVETTKEVPVASNGKVNLWEDEIAPVAVNKEELLRFNRMFSVATHGEVPGETIILIEQLSKLLISKGFTFRFDGNVEDKAGLTAYNASKVRAEVYLPWKGFNKEVTGKLARPTEKAYGYAAGIHRAFTKIPPTVRAIVARNVHVMLGDECNTPLNLFITYTPDGAETKKDVNMRLLVICHSL